MALNLFLNPLLIPSNTTTFLRPSLQHPTCLQSTTAQNQAHQFSLSLQNTETHNYKKSLPIHCALSSPQEAASYPTPPTSREEAISQAKSCLSTALQKPLNNTFSVPTSKLKKQKQPKYRVEIPIIDDSPSSLTSLTFEVFADLLISRRGSKPSLLLLWSSTALIDLANQAFKNSALSVKNLHLASVTADALSSCDVAVFVSPEASQLEAIRRTSNVLYPKPVVLFNPKWSFEEEDGLNANVKSFVGSFDVLYSFIGLEVKGIMSKTKGVVFRCVKDGEFGGEDWVIMVEEEEGKKKGEMKVVSRFKRRPAISEVEVVLYNLVGANSPVTKSAKFLRELVSTVTGGKSKQ